MKTFIKKEPVLTIALILAVISAFFVKPDIKYLDYIDFRTLGILFSLMAVMAGFKELGVFKFIALEILNHAKNLWHTLLVLVMLCFFFSMLITNDVALITFVPVTLEVLNLLGSKQKSRLLIPIVTMQTIAANLGSMLTPIGNPQNLYLYGKADMELSAFIKLMFPYSLVAFILLLVWCFIKGRFSKNSNTDFTLGSFDTPSLSANKKALTIYTVLFILCMFTVARLLPWQFLCVIVLITLIFTDKKVISKVDYSLLMTFIAFFIFIGNMGRVESFYKMLADAITGSETNIAIISSQIISNVPAALLLSGFTDRFPLLIIGTNLGGLGTLIASMASLISFKYVARENDISTAKYLGYFTVWNVIFLIILLIINAILI